MASCHSLLFQFQHRNSSRASKEISMKKKLFQHCQEDSKLERLHTFWFARFSQLIICTVT